MIEKTKSLKSDFLQSTLIECNNFEEAKNLLLNFNFLQIDGSNYQTYGIFAYISKVQSTY